MLLLQLRVEWVFDDGRCNQVNHYPHHIGDFDRATRHLTRIERSIYRDLIDVYYDTEQPLTLDLSKLKRKILANDEQESTAVEQVLNEFFTETPAGWFHSRCDDEIEKYRANNSQKALAGKASAVAKALKKQQMLNGKSTDVETDVEQTNNGTSTNQEPRTKNHINTTSESEISDCPHDELIDLFAKKLPTLAQPRKSLWLKGKNAPALKTRWRWVMTECYERGERKGARMATTKAEGLAWFERFFAYVAESDFLTGKTGKFSCDLGWLVNAANFEKVVQGNYENKGKAV